jgi:hypothetical protein
MNTPAQESFRRLLGEWERAAAQMAGAVVRDPNTLELGATLLKMQLMWKRALDRALDLTLEAGK